VRPAGAIAAAAAAGWAAPALAPHVPPVCRALRIGREADLGPGEVLLTFDDGPHAEGTPAVLAALEAAGARALFFLVGEQVRRDPGVAREVAAAGHELAVHGDRHLLQTRRPPAALRDDLDRAAALVADAAGRAPRWHRPPYGVYSPAGLAQVRRRGWAPLLWSAWGRDWRRRASGANVAALVLRDAAPGGVVLLHDADHYSAPGSWRATAAALPRILDGLAARGLSPADPARARPGA
jgi:peptidoglycan/xylan/chitin deacetylase (PgdA/CDA1 family)